MSEESSKIPDSLRLKFPELRPIKRTPVLYRINGIGFGLYGKRDFDDQTRTYVKTYCFCLLFIPIFAVGAYRVADAQRGWYFIGKQRLSSFAKSCNWGLLCLTLMFAAIMTEHAVTSSPDYRAGQELKRAGQILRAGNALRESLEEIELESPEPEERLMQVHEVLEELESENRLQAQIVKLRFFCGLIHPLLGRPGSHAGFRLCDTLLGRPCSHAGFCL